MSKHLYNLCEIFFVKLCKYCICRSCVSFSAFLPAFFGVRVKVPLTVRQWELSPPQTPHLSSTLVEPISLLQPTF